MPERGKAVSLPAGAVREQTRSIAASKVFARSERLRSFLSFVVEETLAGRGERIKEYTVAADVFGRSATYDTGSDALVRVEARRLRRKLSEYYETEGRAATVVIELPMGSYRPVFSRGNGAGPGGVRRRWWAVVALLVVGAVSAGVLSRSPRADPDLTFGGDARARELYWQGVYLRRELTEASLRKSVDVFEQVVRRQPESARARAALADSYAWIAFFHLAPWQEATAKAQAAASEALRRDRRQALAWQARALIDLFKTWDWPGAETCFRQALAADPGNAQIHQSYALGLVAHGRSGEALRNARRALELDPLSHVANNDLSLILYCSRRFQESGNRALETQAVRPSYAPAYAMSGMSEAGQGQFAQAAAEFRKGADLSHGSPYYLARLADALARGGDRAGAAQVVAELESKAATEFVPHVNQAWPYIGLGDTTRVFAGLESAMQGRETDLLFLGVDAIYDPLRSDPRFQAILRRLGLN
jgi:Tfp pilus assembly protein PilF